MAATDDEIRQPPAGLAFETSCRIGSVALGREGIVLEERMLSAPRAHAVEFVQLIADLCRDHGVTPEGIDRVAVSHGPGSFTGLRIGVTAARMLAMASSALLFAVSTLEVIAQNAAAVKDPPEHVSVVLDAKRNRVYASSFRFDGSRYVALDEPAEVAPEAYLAKRPADTLVLGEGVARYREAIERAGLAVGPDESHQPRASVVYRLCLGPEGSTQSVAPRDFVPRYVRIPEAEERWAKRHGTA